MTEIGLFIYQVIVFDTNGISIFSKSFNEIELDHALLSAFFSAIRQFAANMITGEVEGIKIGIFNLNFKVLPMEDDALVFVMISSGYSSNDADNIADRFAEHFAINFESFLQDRDATYENFKKNPNQFLNKLDRYYSPLCEEMKKKLISLEPVSLDLPIRVPRDILSLLYDIMRLNPQLGKIYQQGTIDILIESIQNYIHSSEFKNMLEAKYLRDAF